MAAKLPIEKLGYPILIVDGVDSPCGVAVNQRGEVVVAEWDGDCVSVFNPGDELRSFGKCGSGQGEFHYPCGVAAEHPGSG